MTLMNRASFESAKQIWDSNSIDLFKIAQQNQFLVVIMWNIFKNQEASFCVMISSFQLLVLSVAFCSANQDKGETRFP